MRINSEEFPTDYWRFLLKLNGMASYPDVFVWVKCRIKINKQAWNIFKMIPITIFPFNFKMLNILKNNIFLNCSHPLVFRSQIFQSIIFFPTSLPFFPTLEDIAALDPFLVEIENSFQFLLDTTGDLRLNGEQSG